MNTNVMNAMISVHVKMLNGDLIEIQHRPQQGFQQFIRLLYKACPEIPYGCLILRKDYADENKEDKKEDKVNDVSDGDLLYALVDTSLVLPFIQWDDEIVKVNNKKFAQLSVEFCERNEELEDGMYAYDQIGILYNKKDGVFALKSAFIAPTPSEWADYHQRKKNGVYRELYDTQWFNSITDCILSSPGIFPRDHFTMDRILTEFEKE